MVAGFNVLRVLMQRFITISGYGGESTLLEELRRRGFATVDEPGRRVVIEELKRGGGALPWENPVAPQRFRDAHDHGF